MNATATIDPRFVVDRQGKSFVLYAGLLDQAHREGLARITTKLLQAPSGENGQVAICWAEVETDRGTFSGIGDASPENVGRMIAMHTIRMAETRAKARALRDALNIGGGALEELGPDEDEQPVRTYPARATRTQVVPSTADEAQASKEQIVKLVKLHAALGRTSSIPASISQEEAAAQIAELVRIFNAQALQKAGAYHA